MYEAMLRAERMYLWPPAADYTVTGQILLLNPAITNGTCLTVYVTSVKVLKTFECAFMSITQV